MVADHWLMLVEKVLEAMEITSDTTRIRLAASSYRARPKGDRIGLRG